MNEVVCESWTDFEHHIGALDADATWIFRGHADIPLDPLIHPDGRWLVQSQFERGFERMRRQFPPGVLKEGKNYDSEFVLLKRLRPFKEALARVHPASQAWNEFQLWAFGRHFGLVTRLLDWTRSPLVAGFFAFEAYLRWRLPGIEVGWFGLDRPRKLKEQLIGSVSIWAFRDSKELECADFLVRDSEAPEPLASRQLAQRGLFTELLATTAYDLEKYLVQRSALDRLTRFILPGAAAVEVLNYLSRRGVSYSTMFPDPEGCARTANLPENWGHSW